MNKTKRLASVSRTAFCLLGSAVLAVPCLVPVQAAGYTGWQPVERGWTYHVNGVLVQNKWMKIGGVWYHFDFSGWMDTGWNKIDGKWYYFDGSGAMRTGWLKSGGLWYYLKSDGTMANSGWLKIGVHWYCFDNDGHMFTGWLKDNGAWYYLYENGVMAADAWVYEEYYNTRYYFNHNGVMTKQENMGQSNQPSQNPQPETPNELSGLSGWKLALAHLAQKYNEEDKNNAYDYSLIQLSNGSVPEICIMTGQKNGVIVGVPDGNKTQYTELRSDNLIYIPKGGLILEEYQDGNRYRQNILKLEGTTLKIAHFGSRDKDGTWFWDGATTNPSAYQTAFRNAFDMNKAVTLNYGKGMSYKELLNKIRNW